MTDVVHPTSPRAEARGDGLALQDVAPRYGLEVLGAPLLQEG